MTKGSIIYCFTMIFFVQDEGEIPSEDEKFEEGSRNIIFEDVHFNYPARPDVNVIIIWLFDRILK